jgi:hypothetical protein
MDAYELKHLEEIERYLDGEMTDQERLAFEQRLTTEPLLKQEYDVLSSVIKQVQNSKRDELKSLLQKADLELDDKPVSQPKGILFWRYAIAASITLMIGLSVFYYYNSKVDNREKLVAAYWKKDNGLPVLMDEKSNASLDNAMTAYKGGNYDYAFSQFEALTQTDTVLYYEGLCSFELKKDATTYIKPLAENNRSVFQSKAKYYLLLLYIKADKKQDAINLLNELLKDTDHPYREQILKLSQEPYLSSK